MFITGAKVVLSSIHRYTQSTELINILILGRCSTNSPSHQRW